MCCVFLWTAAAPTFNFFFFNDTATTEIYTLSLHDALPLYFGDGHAAMGDGEIAGSAVEVPMRARLQVDVVKGKKTGWPRFENEKEIMCAGIYRPVDDALRIAFTALVNWIHTAYGLSDLD